jgi:HlyD family secretion protein
MTVTVDQIVAGRRRGRGRFWLIALLVLGLGGGYWLWSGQTAATGVVAYDTTPAAIGDITVTVTAVGTVQPVQTVDVSSQVAGNLTAVAVQENQKVVKGQALATIDTSALEAALARDRAAISAQEASVAQATITRDESAVALERARKMADRGIVTQEALSTAEAAAKRAEAGLAAALAQKAVAEADLQLAEVNMAKACICAPIDGVVLSTSATLGQTVSSASSGDPLFTLAADLTQMQLKLDVDESDIGRVAMGNAASFTVEAYQNQIFPAEVTSIAYASQTVDGVVTYATTLSLDNAQGQLRPGMTAAADITVQEAKGVLTVANAAFRYSPPKEQTAQRSSGLLGMLFSRPPSNAPISAGTTAKDGTRSLWVLRSGTVTEVRVTTGATDGTLTEILDGGLVAGDQVITGTKAGS